MSIIRAGFKGPRGPGPQASHQQRASHQTRHILGLFVIHASCLQNWLTHLSQKTEDILILNPQVLSPGPFFLAQICTKLFSGWGFARDPAWGAHSAPRVRIGPERTGTAFRFFLKKPERRSGSFFFENSERKSDSCCCVHTSVLPSVAVLKLRLEPLHYSLH